MEVTRGNRVNRRVSRHKRMRTAEQYRNRQLETLPLALQRPAFFCGSQGDLFYGTIIRDLVWLEERPQAETDHAFSLLKGCRRVFGQFWFQNQNAPDQYENEVASTYAQVAFRLGYYTPDRLLTTSEFRQLASILDSDFFQRDHTQSELVAQFGKPSHDVLGGQTTVHCFACEDRTRDWIYFDYSRCYPPEDRVTYRWFDDEILRDVRRQDNRFELLPFADWFRNLEYENG